MENRPLGEFRVKIALLGPDENVKAAFLNRISQLKLSNSQKEIIGVNMGTLKIDTTLLSPPKHSSLQISFWDIDCSAKFSVCREHFIRGAGAALVFLDGDTYDQGTFYCREIQQQDLSISIGLVILLDPNSSHNYSQQVFRSMSNQYECIDFHEPEEIVPWVVEKLGQKLLTNLREGCVSLLTLPKRALLGESHPATTYLPYVPLSTADADITPRSLLNTTALESFLERLGFPVRDSTSVVKNTFGEFRISLRDGTVQFIPQKCLNCNQGCPQVQNICIIGKSKGYSSNPLLSQVEMTLITKIIALYDEKLPKPVLKQLSRRIKCRPPQMYKI